MRRVLRRQGPREDNIVVQSTSEIEREGISSLVKKPFRCLVGGREYGDGAYGHHVMPPEEQYIPPGEIDYGFETTLQELKKKKPTKSRSFRKHKDEPLTRNRSLEEYPMDKNIMTPYAFPQSNRLPSGEELDAIVRSRSRSFVDAIPPGKKNDPLDSESIRDVSKALREMERKLAAAGTEGRKVSRTKVMKALLQVVDQLDEEQAFGPMLTAPPNASVNNTSADLYRTWAGGDADAVALDRQRRNLEQMRELTITPNKEYSGRAESPWKGDKLSFTKLNEEFKAASTEETEAEPEYISSSSDEEDEEEEEEEEEETFFSEETEQSRSASKTGSFAHGFFDEETTLEGTLDSEDASYFPQTRRGKNLKGSFAHAVSPSAARSVNRNPGFDMFRLDMKDPAVHDALADLLWIPSPSKTIDASKSKHAVVSPHSLAESDGIHKMRNNDSMLSYQGEDEYYDRPDTSEETTAATTQSSLSAASQQQQQQQQQQRRKGRPRENSWWQRRNRVPLKPSSKDTPAVEPRQAIQTKVTVTQQEYADLVPWQDEDHRWQEH